MKWKINCYLDTENTFASRTLKSVCQSGDLIKIDFVSTSIIDFIDTFGLSN